ncbi:MAG TPA: enoyl-CoA hydratase family protein, partial [Acidimicrobiales bacterium]|nr:enoyl-CoA hydratase family protein [Acidimicrobiales bacterium]
GVTANQGLFGHGSSGLLRRQGRTGPLSETLAGGVAPGEVSKPPVNALDIARGYALAHMLDGYRRNPDVRVVLLCAEGRGFCAGVDIKEMQSLPDNEGILEANRSCFEAFRAVYECAVPVVAAVNGHCLGSGIGLVGNADVVIADDDAEFGLPEVDNGALGAATHLMRLVPAQRARWMLYSCETAMAAELLAYGSVLDVVPAVELRTRATEAAILIATKDAATIRAAKASLNGIDPIDVRRSYRYEQGFTYELNLRGIGDTARDAFLRGDRGGEAPSA